tara:strand:- start:762 stop:1343 length:582 start_codon:yes stop_codon:yes gene_type:complete
MAICIVILPDQKSSYELIAKIKEAQIPLREYQIIQPKVDLKLTTAEEIPKTNAPNTIDTKILSKDFNAVEFLNPKLAKSRRQKNMALWLMPFGFLAGLTFSNMTGLTTFSDLGIGGLGEPLMGGVVGMTSGWIGSQFAAASVKTQTEGDIKFLKKKNEDGKWLLLLNTPSEIEPPWNLIKTMKDIDIIRFANG